MGTASSQTLRWRTDTTSDSRVQFGSAPSTLNSTTDLAGATEVLCLGGVAAIGAMAYGTESIDRVDKIFGPGNTFVMLAKKQVYGVVGIDALPGPTETVIVADEDANPAWVAADLLAQAEHTTGTAILVTPSRALAAKVGQAIESQIAALPEPSATAKSRPSASAVPASVQLVAGSIVRPETARLMIQNQNGSGLTGRGLGFNVGKAAGSEGCSEKTFGHTGSTGTIAWADPTTRTICVVLTSLPARAVQPHPRDLVGNRVAKASLG